MGRNEPVERFIEADPGKESIAGELVCVVLPSRGEGVTEVFETRFGVVKSVGDSWESEAKNGEAELLSLNNNPLLLSRPNFALSVLGTGRARAGSFAAMELMRGRVGSVMGTPNSRR